MTFGTFVNAAQTEVTGFDVFAGAVDEVWVQVGGTPVKVFPTTPPVPASKYELFGAETIITTNHPPTDLDAGYVMELDFVVTNLAAGTHVVAGNWGGNRRFCLQVSSNGSCQHRILTDPNNLAGVTSSVNIQQDVKYHAILTWEPDTIFRIDIDGTVNNGTPPSTLRASTNQVAIGARTGSPFSDFFTGFVENWTLTPTSGRNAELITDDSGVGNINGLTWTDQFGTSWDVNGNVIASSV